MVRFEFGVFDSFDLGSAGPGRVLAERLEFAAEAERLGFGHYHLAEHHATPLSVCPSPNLFLAALTQRTTTIRMGALVYVLPAYDPFRLAEEIAALDQLSGGRLDCGVGRGISPYELSVLGVEAGHAKDIYAESLRAITEALAAGRMRHRGVLLRSYDAELSVRPLQRPYPPLWYPSSNTASAEWAGHHAINFIGRWNSGTLGEAVERYWVAWERGRGDRTRLNAHVEHPSVGLAGTIVIAPTDAEAERIYLRAHELYGRRLLKLWHDHDDHRYDAMADGGLALRTGAACVGSPETVRDMVLHQVGATGVNYLEAQLFFGDMTLGEARQSLRSFADVVMPAVLARNRRGSKL
ncbi:MAG TPA: LLM class flavin-dependent oxidoreductase [Streptosporangiaceae bacterium]|nr:LLM class flavin-dependent oxidoreductase [Streptosporangiaceae bacterium]